jgi:hypothetical protein
MTTSPYFLLPIMLKMQYRNGLSEVTKFQRLRLETHDLQQLFSVFCQLTELSYGRGLMGHVIYSCYVF